MMNRKIRVMIIILSLLSFSSIKAQDWEEDVNARNIMSELLGATLGGVIIGVPVAAIAGPIWVHNVPEYYKYIDPYSDAGWVPWTYLFCGTIGAPLGTVISGKIIHDHGSTLGAFAGGIIGTGLVYLSLKQHFPDAVTIPAVFLGPQICSIIGYKLISHKNNSQSNVFPKNLPAIGLSVLPQKHDYKISTKLGASITVRF